MFTKIKEIIFFIFALLVGIFEIGSSGKDYKVYSFEDRVALFEENKEAFQETAEYILKNRSTVNNLESMMLKEAEKGANTKLGKLAKTFKDKVMVHHSKNGYSYVVFDYMSGIDGYSSCGLYYCEDEVYIEPKSDTSAEYDSELGTYIVYQNTASIEIVKIDDNWFFFKKAYYNNDGFKTRPVSLSDDAPVTSYGGKYLLSNSNADEKTQRLYDYICDNYGTHMMAAQQESTWMSSPDYEMEIIEETTGKLPAIRGLDFMNGDFDGVVKRAKEWDEKGGIVTICWHTGINGKGYTESLGDKPDFDKLLTPGTDEYNAMMENWDKAAKALAELRDAGVPVLWRPFHEFDGGWFWWGKKGGENFTEIWQMMYDKYTNEYELTNLIWVLGYSGEVKNGWYPGDEYCDIIGSDTYDGTTNVKAWKKLDAMNTGKPLTFHECGNLPKVTDFTEDGAVWSWFMIWHTEYVDNQDKENLREIYNSELVITLDEVNF